MRTCKRTPIRLSADFSAETLQPRREWHDRFKVMKGKNLQPRILYSARLLQIWWRNQKLFRQAKVKRIQHNQTSITTNAKGTSLGRKHKRRKSTTKNKPKTINKMVTGSSLQFSSSLSHVRLLATPWIAARRPPCPSPTPGAYSDSCLLSQWCHPAISSSVIPFSSCLQSFPVSGSFQMSQFLQQVAKVLEFQLQHQFFQ